MVVYKLDIVVKKLVVVCELVGVVVIVVDVTSNDKVFDDCVQNVDQIS